MEQKRIKRPISGIEEDTNVGEYSTPETNELRDLEYEYRRLSLIKAIILLQNDIDELTRAEDEKPDEAED